MVDSFAVITPVNDLSFLLFLPKLLMYTFLLYDTPLALSHKIPPPLESEENKTIGKSISPLI